MREPVSNKQGVQLLTSDLTSHPICTICTGTPPNMNSNMCTYTCG